MSPRTSASSSRAAASSPYARRPTSQPKSSRQQFSACGACRMRRVRCDLKDLPADTAVPHPACSNCKERGIRCVDEFADVKAVKLLRRGRRLQQVESIYGKIADQEQTQQPRLQTTVPSLQPEFFASHFWRWFVVQRPVLDLVEFPARFQAYSKGSHPLTNEGNIIALVLVAWAASMGLDERGLPLDESGSDSKSEQDVGRRSQRKGRCERYVRDILEVIDCYGVLRRPTLDGACALLLLLPLLEEAQPIERQAIYEATMSHVNALCVLCPSGSEGFEDAAARARLFLYAYTQEGITTGLHGGRLALNTDDFDAFQRTLPSMGMPIASSSSATLSGAFSREERAQKSYYQLISISALTLAVGDACRKIHDVLNGPKASRRAAEHGVIDANGMREIWGELDRCWQDFDTLHRDPPPQIPWTTYELDRFVHGWQVFIFECHNVIRESLKEYMSNSASQAASRPSSSHTSSPYLSPHHLHSVASRKCSELLPRVVALLRDHISNGMSREDANGLFCWDVGLIRNGCFFSGYLAATTEGDMLEMVTDAFKRKDGGESGVGSITVDEGVSICLTAIATMQWGLSKSEERKENIRLIWGNRKLGGPSHSGHYDSGFGGAISLSSSHLHVTPSLPATPEDRPLLPPLSLFPTQRRVESAPATAATTDGRGVNGWPSYTPPGTATSVGTSTSTGFSGRASPVFANMVSFKPSSDDLFYHSSGDLDHFSYNVPLGAPMVREGGGLAGYGPRHAAIDSHGLGGTTGAGYMSSGSFPSPTSHIVGSSDFASCPQFGDNCNGSYH